MRTGNIYIIRNKINDKVYVGQTTMTVRERFMCHMKPSTKKQKRTYKLYDAVAKYGRENFYVETLETNVPLGDLNNLEIYYIAKFDSYYHGYNSTKGGDGRIINKIENQDKLLGMARSGYSADQIASVLRVNKATVFRTLHNLGFFFHVNQADIIELSKTGMSNNAIAEALGCSAATVTRALERANLRKHRKPVNLRNDFNADEIMREYYNQTPIKELCDKFGITQTTFYRIKSSGGYKTRPQIYKHKTRYFE